MSNKELKTLNRNINYGRVPSLPELHQLICIKKQLAKELVSLQRKAIRARWFFEKRFIRNRKTLVLDTISNIDQNVIDYADMHNTDPDLLMNLYSCR